MVNGGFGDEDLSDISMFNSLGNRQNNLVPGLPLDDAV
jgi:hypothetical protein